jgi:hypothetical protein
MIPRTNLLTRDVPVEAPEGIVYSTSPVTAEGVDLVSYFTKGPELEIVFAEIAGCALAKEVGLPVANVAACVVDEIVLAGSVGVPDAIRYIGPWLSRRQKITNFNDLFDSIVVDVWLANKDRNIGNVVGRPRAGSSSIDLVFIDFEKSATLRPNPTVLSTLLEPRLLWPSGELGEVLRATRPLHPPLGIVHQINQFTEELCGQIITEVVDAIGSPVEWRENSTHALLQRANRIKDLAEEVWRTA